MSSPSGLSNASTQRQITGINGFTATQLDTSNCIFKHQPIHIVRYGDLLDGSEQSTDSGPTNYTRDRHIVSTGTNGLLYGLGTLLSGHYAFEHAEQQVQPDIDAAKQEIPRIQCSSTARNG